MTYRTVVNPAYRQHTDFISTIPRDGMVRSVDVFRRSRNVVATIPAPGGGKWVVKKFKTPSLANRVAYTLLRPSKADRTYDYGLRLARMGFGTPTPVAKIVGRRCGLVAEQYAVYDYLPLPTLQDLLDEASPDERRRLLDAFVSFTLRLHQAGVLHRDYNITNLLVERVADDYRFHLIDINRMRFGAAVGLHDALRALSRLELDPDTLRGIIGQYAERRGADPQKAMHFVSARKRRRHWRKAITHPLRRWLGRIFH